MTRFLLGWAFDTFINLRYCIAELGKEIANALGDAFDDALDVWEEDE